MTSDCTWLAKNTGLGERYERHISPEPMRLVAVEPLSVRRLGVAGVLVVNDQGTLKDDLGCAAGRLYPKRARLAAALRVARTDSSFLWNTKDGVECCGEYTQPRLEETKEDLLPKGWGLIKTNLVQTLELRKAFLQYHDLARSIREEVLPRIFVYLNHPPLQHA